MAAEDYGVTEVEETVQSLLGGHPPIEMPITLATDGATPQTITRGTVLAKVTASGKYVGFDPDGADGSETAAVILARDVTVDASVDSVGLGYVHGEFREDELVWTHTGITENEKAAAVADLMAAGIYCK